MNEENNCKWKDIPLDNYGQLYQVSDSGLIRNKKTNKLRKQTQGKYMYLALNYKGKTKNCLVHRLVALAFIPNDNPDRKQVNHIDGDHYNNNVDNLEWVTAKEDTQHSLNNKLSKGRSVKVRCLTKEGEEVAIYNNILEASKATGANDRHISCVCRGKRITTGGYKWEYVDEDYDLNNSSKTIEPYGKQYLHYTNYIWTPDGKCYSKHSKKYLLGKKTPTGSVISPCFEGKKTDVAIHRVIAELYVPNPNNYGYVLHKNKDIYDNRVSNLLWHKNTSYKNIKVENTEKETASPSEE